jgi:sporulation protein YlmC with PRC-barrel domain
MPRHDRFDDDLMSRERRDRMDRDYQDYGDRDRGAFFSERKRRDERGYPRGRMGGWGSLMEDESSGGRSRETSGRRGFGPDDRREGIPRDETDRLIASNKVEGTPVYERNGDRLGTVHNFMVDKVEGHVVYAVLKHGSGFLGFDDRYYPLHWDQLRFDTRLGGYRVNLDEEGLKSLGSWDREMHWSDRGMDRDRDYEQRSRRRQRMHERW